MSKSDLGSPLEKLPQSSQKVRHRSRILHPRKIRLPRLKTMEIHNRIQSDQTHPLQSKKIEITVPYLRSDRDEENTQ